MIKALSVFFACIYFVMPGALARAEPGCDGSEAACVLQATWGAALVLPDEKLERIKPLIVSMASRVGEPELVRFWADKLSISPGDGQKAQSTYTDFGWQNASKVIGEYGVDGLIRFAKEKRAPMNFGRGDSLLAAGKRLAKDQPAQAKRLNTALLDLIRSASAFEAPELAHAAAELAMHRCDLQMFDKATALTNAPNNMRYAFWRTRMTGNSAGLHGRVLADADAEDTRHVRQVLDGYRAIVDLGYCK